MSTDKIRPRTHSSFSASPDDVRRQGEEGLSELAKAPDIGGVARDGDTLSPLEAAQARAGMFEQNRLGKPFQLNQAERLKLAYDKAFEEYRNDYQGTRSERLQRPYLEAKQAMIDAGLMVGDV